ncbi:Integrase core domain-containing protein [Geodermatophilus amargosae]|uniref:Integrase core domain-containing protein n=1 Tax=Geodermatophilus amargosae TaxID=1296565 RepID=A0A1I7CP89_9ACTN|nr:Integrase core domain-containing protein [Geodermatophilus amargosae]
MTAEVRARGHQWNRKRVARLRRIGAIEGIHRRRRGRYGRRTVSTATAADLVERNFNAPAPDQLWVADITYLRTWEGFLYLAVVIDACTRRVVGWAMADHLRTELVLDAVGMALFARKPVPGLVHHSDRGSQGGFNWSTQHPTQEVSRWPTEGVSSRSVCIEGRSPRRGGRRWRGERIVFGSGRRLLVA